MTTIVSFSEVYKWQTCHRQHYYNFILGKHVIIPNDAMDRGSKGHKLLQIFYELVREGKTVKEALEITHRKAQQMVKENPIADFNLLEAWILVDNYIREKEKELTSQVLLVENRFLIPASKFSSDPIFEDVEIGFTPDVVFGRKGGFVDIEDAKFVERAWTEAKIVRFTQLKLYQIFLEAMEYNVSRTTIRFFNVKTAKITFKHYTMGETEKLTLTRDFLSAVKEIVEYKTSPADLLPLAARTMVYSNCGGCSYVFPCTLEAEGKDATKTLNTQYKDSNYDYTK